MIKQYVCVCIYIQYIYVCMYAYVKWFLLNKLSCLCVCECVPVVVELIKTCLEKECSGTGGVLRKRKQI